MTTISKELAAKIEARRDLVDAASRLETTASPDSAPRIAYMAALLELQAFDDATPTIRADVRAAERDMTDAEKTNFRDDAFSAVAP